MSRSSLHRRLALALLLAALWLPGIAAAAAGGTCCPGMAAASDAPPCHRETPPCDSVDAVSCCDVAPAAALPAAQRECSHAAAASLLRALPALPVPITQCTTPAALAAPHAPPLRLSVVLRN
jgi:hypothetical protein